jgi:tRNA (mo5U34)-methyltransferase
MNVKNEIMEWPIEKGGQWPSEWLLAWEKRKLKFESKLKAKIKLTELNSSEFLTLSIKLKESQNTTSMLAKLETDHLNYLEGKGSQSFLQHLNTCEEIQKLKIYAFEDDGRFSLKSPLANVDSEKLKEELQGFMPWRKGPFLMEEVRVDTEWDSSIKWSRLEAYVNLKDKVVLDIGCNSGYYMWRMLGKGASFVLGVDPSSLFYSQYALMRQNLDVPVRFLALGSQELNPILDNCFDVVFSMGILYHRRDPLNAIREWRDLVKSGGTIVLETLTIEGKDDLCLSPYPSYAQMKNCYHLPTDNCLKNWMLRVGFIDVKIVCAESTNFEEQRKTDWVESWSLEKALDPNDSSKTIEGYPAPRRTLMIAKRK